MKTRTLPGNASTWVPEHSPSPMPRQGCHRAAREQPEKMEVNLLSRGTHVMGGQEFQTRPSGSGRVWASAARIRIQCWRTETLREFKVVSITRWVQTLLRGHYIVITATLPLYYPRLSRVSIRNHFTLVEKSSLPCLALFISLENAFPEWKRAICSEALATGVRNGKVSKPRETGNASRTFATTLQTAQFSRILCIPPYQVQRFRANFD